MDEFVLNICKYNKTMVRNKIENKYLVFYACVTDLNVREKTLLMASECLQIFYLHFTILEELKSIVVGFLFLTYCISPS